MSEDALIRLVNLRNYCAVKKWGPADLARATGRKSTSQMSDMLRGDKSFGEKIARDFEKKLGLPRNWFDIPHDKGALEIPDAPQVDQEATQEHQGYRKPPSTGGALRASEPVTNFSSRFTKIGRAPVIEWARLGEDLYKAVSELSQGEFRSFESSKHVSELAKFVLVPDNKLAPDLRQGDWALIDPNETVPRRDRVALFVAPDGEYILRRFRSLPDGDFEAYDTTGDVLTRSRHGITVVGTLVAMQRDDV